MKQPTGSAKPRRAPASPAAPRKKQVRLDLKRRPEPPAPEQEVDIRHQGNFWRWVVLVALFHLLLICVVSIYYGFSSRVKPPDQFISLLPEGDVVKGNPGRQEAHKIGTTTPAHIEHHSAKPPPTAPAVPKTVTPPPKVTPPKTAAPSLDKPIVKPTPVKPKPTPTPPKPKVKVDLDLADGPVTPPDKTKPKLHAKKPTLRADDTADDHESETHPASTGLSKEQVAAKLGDKLDASGVKSATKTGTSGSTNSHQSDFSGFYASVRDQVMSQWTSPNLTDETAINPIVQIYVEKDGHVPPDQVRLIQSSGNSAYDDSAVAAAKGLGHLHEPLPDGCPPTMSINFKLTR